jgi:hypothetical protein
MMAQARLTDENTSYYPRRARWYTRILSAAARPVRRRVLWRPSGQLSFRHVVPSIALPGFSFLALGRPLLGWSCLTLWLLAAVFFLVALGFPAGSLAFGLMISLHATSVVFLEGVWLREARFRTRLAVAFLTLLAVWGLIYQPAVNYSQRHWLMPLRLGNRVLIVRCGVPPQSIHRGDWLAYQIAGDLWAGGHEDATYLRSGLGVDRVLALPRDRVRFTRQTVFVNDQAFPHAPHMPEDGELVIPEKVWFIWPSLDITGHGRVVETQVSATMQRVAMVTQKQIIGRPFKHWFGRRQWP